MKNSWLAKSKCFGDKRNRLECACKARKI